MRCKRLAAHALLAIGLVLGGADLAVGYVSVDLAAEGQSRRYELDVEPVIKAPPLDYTLEGSTYGCNLWIPSERYDEYVLWPAGAFGPSRWSNPCLGGTAISWEHAWAAWYYQERFSDDGVACHGRLPLEIAPLYLANRTSYGPYELAHGWPDPPTYSARFEAIGGMGHLKNVPLEWSNTAVPVVASARYKIVIDGEPTPHREDSPGIYWGDIQSSAMFFLTALYDESLFDVTIEGQYRWSYNYVDWNGTFYESVWVYAKDYRLSTGSPLLFTAEDYATYGKAAPPEYTEQYGVDQVGKRDDFWQVPEYVTVRLKPNRTLDEMKGRRVTLMLHSVTHAEPSHNSNGSWNGDTLRIKCTGYVQVGAEGKGEDWRIQPPPLKDECVPPSFEDPGEKETQADILGTSTINTLNMDLPSLRVGHNRFRVGRTLSETLGNEAYYEAFWTKAQGPLADGLPPVNWVDYSFVRVSVQGAWFAVGVAPLGSEEFSEAGDVPGWWAEWDTSSDGLRLNVYDAYSNLVYRFLADKRPGRPSTEPLDILDYAFRPAKLVQVDQASTGNRVRTYEYSDDSRTTLTRQFDSANNEITYGLDATTHELTIVGNGTRTIKASFISAGGDSTGYCLQSASWGAGSAWRTYEWIPMHDPLGPNDGKLTSIRDVQGRYLAYLQYEAADDPVTGECKGRLVKVTRGPANGPEQDVVATFDWQDPEYTFDCEDSEPPPLNNTTMEAKFYVDGTYYERICRTFDPKGRLAQIDQYQERLPASGDNPVAITRFEHHDPEEIHPPMAPPAPGFFWQELPGGCLVARCTTKVLPGERAAEYTQYDATKGFNSVQTLLAPYPGNPNVEPPVDGRRNWTGFEYGWISGEWRKTSQIQYSLDEARTDYEYDQQGFLKKRLYPEILAADGSTVRPEQTCGYHPTGDTEFPYDYRQTDTATRNAVTTTYQCDDYGYPTQQTDTAGGISLTYGFGFNVFGQKRKDVDAEGYVHWTEYDPVTGLMTGTCTSEAKNAPSPEGNVLRQTQYVYENGMIHQVRVADNPGPFPKDNPQRWIETTFSYDDYGRLASKTVRDPVSLADLTTNYRFDRQDRLILTAWPDGRWKRITRDGQGRINLIEYGKGNPDEGGIVLLKSTYQYDITGNLIRRTTEGCPKCGRDTEYQYDVYNRRTAEIRHEVTQ